MINLLDYNQEELTKFVLSLDEPKFRANQLYNAMLNGKNYSDSTVLPKGFLEKLSVSGAKFQAVSIHKAITSKDKTVKFLFKLNDENIIEGVLMQYKFGRTLCISTQVGCKMNCAFCASGLNYVRNLTSGEILGQVVAVNAFLKGSVAKREITNIVLMGSGEPLDNFDNVTKFLKEVTNEKGLNFGVRNITLSTCGIPSKIEKLADLGLSINLAISLHASNNRTRKEIMPIAKSFSIESVIDAAKYYYQLTNRRIIVEYALISGVNDSMDNARELAHVLSDMNCHVNLIRLNDVKERGLIGAPENKMNLFMRELIKCGISTTIRRSLGDDIEGACGQLRNRELNGKPKFNNKEVSKSASYKGAQNKRNNEKADYKNFNQNKKFDNAKKKQNTQNVKSTRSETFKKISKLGNKQNKNFR